MQEARDIGKKTGLWPDQGFLSYVAVMEGFISELLQNKLYL